MAEIDSLLEEIARDQGDDDLRWRAAVLYDRQGYEARARFIRLQLQLAALPDGVDSPEWLPMIEESERLLRRYYEEWNAPYNFLEVLYPQYDRGFIEEAGVQGQALLDRQYRTQIFGRLPIRHIDVIADIAETRLSAILNIPELSNMVSLGFDSMGLGDGHIEAFAQCELPKLRWLSLTRNHLTEKGVLELARIWRETMPLLEFVELAGNPYDPEDEIDYDQDVALTWRRGAGGETEELLGMAPWLLPRIVDGRVEPRDRLALARPNPSGTSR
jgi:hypothetical protein